MTGRDAGAGRGAGAGLQLRDAVEGQEGKAVGQVVSRIRTEQMRLP
ncbi:MAG TPA: hypothetical protein VF795_06625 [Desulfuromonadaceae bacterium]